MGERRREPAAHGLISLGLKLQEQPLRRRRISLPKGRAKLTHSSRGSLPDA
jgi:hypothetical protein